MLRFLAEQGIAIGDRCVVTARQPFDGPITARFGDAEHVLGRTLARAMRIELDDAADRSGAASARHLTGPSAGRVRWPP